MDCHIRLFSSNPAFLLGSTWPFILQRSWSELSQELHGLILCPEQLKVSFRFVHIDFQSCGRLCSDSKGSLRGSKGF
jgi:hypothetical protein